MKQRISVIVPVYNVERYLKKCVDSLLAQTLPAFELILVDDGSTDSSGALCNAYAAREERVRVVHKQNGGLSDARNAGLDVAGGELVTFVDSDDFVRPDFLQLLYEPFLQHPGLDLSAAGICEVPEGQEPPSEAPGPVELLPAREAMRRMLLRQGMTHSACGKLYRRSLWQEVRFPVGRLYEDYLTTYAVLLGAGQAAFSQSRPYCYLQRDGSIMHDACTQRTLTLLDAADEVTELLLHRAPELRAEALDLQLSSYLKCMQHILNTGWRAFPAQQTRILQKNRQCAPELLRSGKVPRNDKVKMLLLLISKRLFLAVYNHFDGCMQVG